MTDTTDPIPIGPQEMGRLFDEHAGALGIYAGQWSGSPADCVQEAFIELASQTVRPDSPTAWLYRVVRNKAINALRSQRRRSDHEKTAGCRTHFGDSAIAKSRVEVDDLNAALAQLEDQGRELILLRIWSGLSWQQIAELTGKSSSAAQRQYVAELKKLKTILEPSCPLNLNCPPS